MHTPGPWFLTDEGVNGTDYSVIVSKTKKGLDNEVLGTSEWIRVETDDLKLMSAAPELYEACKAMFGLQFGTFTQEDLNRIMSMAIEAVKKAEGK